LRDELTDPQNNKIDILSERDPPTDEKQTAEFFEACDRNEKSALYEQERKVQMLVWNARSVPIQGKNAFLESLLYR